MTSVDYKSELDHSKSRCDILGTSLYTDMFIHMITHIYVCMHTVTEISIDIGHNVEDEKLLSQHKYN